MSKNKHPLLASLNIQIYQIKSGNLPDLVRADDVENALRILLKKIETDKNNKKGR